MRVKIDRKIILRSLGRCLLLLCPECGNLSIFQKRFTIRHHCFRCGTLFQREDGFFMGSILVNVVATELIILASYVLLLVIGVEAMLTVKLLLAMAVLFPLAFYHHGWSFWLSFNHLVNPLPKMLGERVDTFTEE